MGDERLEIRELFNCSSRSEGSTLNCSWDFSIAERLGLSSTCSAFSPEWECEATRERCVHI
jgi:hypothetical protein